MVSFMATLLKFGQKGEKTGWTVIEIPAELAHQLLPETRTSFRVKGSLDTLEISGLALIPVGEGDFILPLNATLRKALRKRAGDSVMAELEVDTAPLPLSADLLLCLEDEPQALAFFNTLTKGHRKYFSNWIEEAKTQDTKARLISQAVVGLSMQLGYGEMVRYFKKKKEEDW